MKDHETQGRGLFISALGYFAFLQSEGIWGLLCKLTMFCAIPTVSRDSSRNREHGWDFIGSRIALEAPGEGKEYRSKKKGFNGQDNNPPLLCLFLWPESLCLCLFSPFFLSFLSRGHFFLWFSTSLWITFSWLLIKLYLENLPRLPSPAVKLTTPSLSQFQKSP